MIKNAKLPEKTAPDKLTRSLVGGQNVAQLGALHGRKLHRAGHELGNVINADDVL